MAFGEVVTGIYDSIVYSLPPNLQIIPKLVIFAVMIAVYGIFVFLFYRFLAKRDILRINFRKYNVFEHAGAVKFFAAVLYIVQFAIIIPIVITIWFGVFSVLLLILVKEQAVSTILLISAGVIGAIRIAAYFNEDLSRDLAKMFPFTLLSVAILTPGFFDTTATIARISEVVPLLTSVLYYAIFIAVIEFILRIFHTAYSAITSGGEDYGLGAYYEDYEQEPEQEQGGER